VSTVRSLLINNLPSQFDLVLVSIGATNFTQRTAELNNNNNNNIGRYLTSTKEKSTTTTTTTTTSGGGGGGGDVEEEEKEREYQDDDVWADLHELHAGPNHQQKKIERKRMMGGSDNSGKVSYKNEEAVAIEKMMKSGGLGKVEGEVDGDMKLAVELQLEESERWHGGGGGGGGGGGKRKAEGRGPLDVFFSSSKKMNLK